MRSNDGEGEDANKKQKTQRYEPCLKELLYRCAVGFILPGLPSQALTRQLSQRESPWQRGGPVPMPEKSRLFPESIQCFREGLSGLQILQVSPVAGEQPGILAAGKAVIQQKHHAFVFAGADDPPCRL